MVVEYGNFLSFLFEVFTEVEKMLTGFRMFRLNSWIFGRNFIIFFLKFWLSGS